MSDRPIQAGDLVMLVRHCTPAMNNGSLGAVFVVKEIVHHQIDSCVLCGANHTGMYARPVAKYAGTHTRAPLSWLKRIPPLDELEGAKTQEKLREPA